MIKNLSTNLEPLHPALCPPADGEEGTWIGSKTVAIQDVMHQLSLFFFSLKEQTYRR